MRVQQLFKRAKVYLEILRIRWYDNEFIASTDSHLPVCRKKRRYRDDLAVPVNVQGNAYDMQACAGAHHHHDVLFRELAPKAAVE